MPEIKINKKSNQYKITNKNYTIWYWSGILFMLLTCALLILHGVYIYFNIFTLLNQSNQQIINKAGLEIFTEININNLEQAKHTLKKKTNPLTLPNKIRNIFIYDHYIEIETTTPHDLTFEVKEININNTSSQQNIDTVDMTQ